jgi:uncharacterized protein (DUF433 family)
MVATQSVIRGDPDIVSGTPIFVGTRVPVETLFDFLAAGDPLDRSLDDFPSVSRKQALAVLETARVKVLESVHAPSAR